MSMKNGVIPTYLDDADFARLMALAYTSGTASASYLRRRFESYVMELGKALEDGEGGDSQ